MRKILLVYTLIGAIACGILLTSAPASQANDKSEINYQTGLTEYKNGQYKAAALHFFQSIKNGNTTPNAWLYLAHSYAASGKTHEAVKTYQQVAKIFKGTAAASMADSAIKRLDPQNKLTEKTSSNSTTSSSPPLTQTTASAYTSSTSRLPERARVFYESDDDDIMLKVRINGRTLDMALDTGAPTICLDKTHLQKLGISPPRGKPSGYSGGASNSVKIPYWKIKSSVQVGPIYRDNLDIEVFEKMETSPLIGQTFFKDFDYTIDHKARCVEFRRKGSMQAGGSARGYSLPFEFRKSGSRIVVEIEINGQKGKAMLDTGNTADGISFDSAKQMAKFGVRLPANAKLGRSIGVSGSGTEYKFKLARIRLGPIDKSNVSASCALQINPEDEELPLIGQEVLEGWQSSVDMNKKVIHFLRR